VLDPVHLLLDLGSLLLLPQLLERLLLLGQDLDLLADLAF
jgi:hypothetical protein